MKITREMIFAHDLDLFDAEASELGWGPGEFPTKVETDLGNGLPLMLTAICEDVGVYKQVCGCITLRVMND